MFVFLYGCLGLAHYLTSLNNTIILTSLSFCILSNWMENQNIGVITYLIQVRPSQLMENLYSIAILMTLSTELHS